jgi:hypothetical protein
MRPHLTSWPAPHVRRGFKRLYLVIALPWLLYFAILFASATYNYVYSDAEFTRLDTKLTAATAGDPNAPASDEALRVFDHLHDARVRRDDAESQMVISAVRGIEPTLLIFLIWRAFIWVGSAFARK